MSKSDYCRPHKNIKGLEIKQATISEIRTKKSSIVSYALKWQWQSNFFKSQSITGEMSLQASKGLMLIGLPHRDMIMLKENELKKYAIQYLFEV